MSLQGETIEELVTSYNSKLSEILDKHASLKSHRLHPCHSQPWFPDRIKDEIRVRHMKEHMWKNNPTEYNLNAFYQQRRHVANIIKQAQRSFYIEKLLENRTNFKEIFTITNKLLGRNDPSPLPPSEDPARLVQEFSDCFQDILRMDILHNIAYMNFMRSERKRSLSSLLHHQPNPVNSTLSHQNFL